MIVGPDARSMAIGRHRLLITIRILVCVGLSAWWGFWSVFTKEPLIDCCLVRLVMGADAWTVARATVGFDLVAMFVGVGCGGGLPSRTSTEKFPVGLLLISMIVGANTRLAGADPLLYFLSAFIDPGGSIGSTGGWGKKTMLAMVAARYLVRYCEAYHTWACHF